MLSEDIKLNKNTDSVILSHQTHYNRSNKLEDFKNEFQVDMPKLKLRLKHS